MIYLTGFMGSGKTSVGRSLASRLGLQFVDLDDLIVSKTGTSIPDIFTCVGEDGFRMLENRILLELVQQGLDAVVATGGGLPEDTMNRILMKASGYIVYLEAPLDTLKERVSGGQGRPLWNEDVAALLQKRIPVYADADFVLDTRLLDTDRCASEIFSWASGLTSPVPVILRERSYPVYIGSGIFSSFQEFLQRHMRPEGIFVLADEQVLEHHGGRIRHALDGLDYHIMGIPSGEETKSNPFLVTILEKMLTAGVTRGWACMALGGGVTGDIAGFAASIFMRGIPVIQVPTTLLAQVDSSIGGKTAINLDSGKNLAGTFHQPLFVLSDTDFLRTLDEFFIRDAMAEVIKYGIIMERGLFEELEKSPSHEFSRLVRTCARCKARVVSQDEREGGTRRILNFGHTLGHALEKALRYRITHGQAVAAGMIFAAWISRDFSLLSEPDYARIRALITRNVSFPESFALPSVDLVAESLAFDKKSEREGIHFVLTPAIGDVSVQKLTDSQILDAYGRYVNGCSEGL
ncbi:MAG: 3-dehydroquinate synthase [Desulfomonilia bacterium]